MSRLCVAVGMSGGVDSSMAARLLIDAGYEVVGITMLIWDNRRRLEGVGKSGCYGPGEKDDLDSARHTADRLGIPHHAVSLVEEYNQWVLKGFREQYLAGMTPNPCAVCNPVMKFGFLIQRARAQGIRFDRFATGHYAQILRDSNTGQSRLFSGVDKTKDQSYFLARMTHEQLADVLFPLGDKTKAEIKRLARAAGLGHLADKPESQDFFEGEDRASLFTAGDLVPGPIVDTKGALVGTHRGIVCYTVGQREGLGLALGRKVYVKEIRTADNSLVVGDRDAVTSSSCRVADPRWISGTAPADGARLVVRLRYRHAGVSAVVSRVADDCLRVAFDEPQFAVTPGQLAAFYDGDEVLGGGWIMRGVLDS